MSLEKVLESVNKLAEETGKSVKAIEETGIKMADLAAKFKTLEEWQAETEKKLSDKRISLHGGDNVLAAIPDSHKKVVRIAEMMSQQYKQKQNNPMVRACMFPDDPALKAGVSIWMANHILKLTQPAEYMKRLAWHEKLEESLGFGAKEKVALQEDTASEGGNLVPTIVESEILRLIADNSIMRPIVRKVPMTVKTHAYPTRAAAFTAAIIAEEGSITDSVPASPFSQSSLTAKKLACFATVAGELLQDNVVLLADYLAQEFGEQIGRLEDQQALEGDGTGVNFTGVVAAAGVNSVTSGANGDALSYQKLVDALFASGEGSAINFQNLFMHQKLIAALYKSRSGAASATDQGGVPLIAPAGGIQPMPANTILGYRFYGHSGILTNRAVGTGTNRTNLYSGPPQTIIFGDLLGFSIDLNPWSKFQTFQIDIRGVKRTGILVAVPTAWTKYTAIDPLLTMAV
jgi:HK97 family phage major capsid protein